MSSKLFKNFIKKAILEKQGAPGPPPRQGLVWKPQTHRWIRPEGNEEYDHAGEEIPEEHTLNAVRENRSYLANHFIDLEEELFEEIKENSIQGMSVHDRLMQSLDEVKQGKEKHAIYKLADTVNDITMDHRITKYNSPNLTELKFAIESTLDEETGAGLGESHIHGGHDTEDSAYQAKDRTKKYGTSTPVMEHRDERERKERKNAEQAKRMLGQVSALTSPEATKKRGESRRNRAAFETARSDAAARNQRHFGTDPSWFGR